MQPAAGKKVLDPNLLSPVYSQYKKILQTETHLQVVTMHLRNLE